MSDWPLLPAAPLASMTRVPVELVYLLQSLTIVAVFGGLLWGSTWFLRRWTKSRPSGPLEVLAQASLDGRRSIHLVRVGRRVLIVGTGEGGVTRLGTTTMTALEGSWEGAVTAKQAGSGESFASVWARLRASPAAESDRGPRNDLDISSSQQESKAP